ncbi:gamma-glutamyltransferase family protein [Bacillus cereus]|uniref:gamma-glutamyltransferase family protein n=1 Tax=Bacillus cereus TaxID=1396 RepID=UPI000BF6E5AB|nr:gamma-glutamyltransferase [Bacillus cereus]PFA86241.1 capsular biosynthesis protein [Bacillus cereus]
MNFFHKICGLKLLFILSLILITLIFYFIEYSCIFHFDNRDNVQKRESIKKDFAYGVSASHSLAVDEGMKILQQGGNAIDAAIAVSYLLGVVEPYASGLGGGGGMLILNAHGESNFIDYREIAPSQINNRGNTGIPGFVAGMEFAHKKYGSISMSELLKPSIYYAENGFEVDDILSSRLAGAYHRIYSKRLDIFYHDGVPINKGQKLIQKKLSNTLKNIQKKGASAFYQGDIAKELNKITNIPLRDIYKYKVEERKPVSGEYCGYTVYTAPPPFSGVTLLQILKQTELNNTYNSANNLETYIKKMGKITKASYQDRVKTIGDPEFSKMYSKKWISNQYLLRLNNMENILPVEEEHESTTHFVVMDKFGTVVSVTNTLSNFFGTGVYMEGFFLNNQLANFSDSPNQIEPGKRARTFMAPTILEKKGTEIIGIGSPGGNRIPQILALVLDKYFHRNSTLQNIVDESRFIFEKDYLYSETILPFNVQKNLEENGYNVIYKDSPVFYGGVQALIRDEKKNELNGAGDGRRNGSWKSNL